MPLKKEDIEMKNLIMNRFLNFTAIILLGLTFVFSTVSVQAQSKKVEQHLKKAKEFSLASKFDQALSEIDEAIKIEPQNAKIFEHLAELYHLMNKDQNAIEALNQLIELKPNSAEAFFKRGKLYVRLGDFEKALADATKAIQLTPKNLEFYKFRGFIYLNQKNYNSAIVDVTTGIKILGKTKFASRKKQNTEMELLLELRSLAFLMNGDLNNALADLSKIIKLSPNNILAYKSRAELYRKLGKSELALDDALKIREIKSKQREIQSN
jgi:tetratricopeptide (TPR) repeat protein